VPGSGTPALLVGVSMTDDAFPFTMMDAADDAMHAVLEVPAGSPDVVRCFR
jgi:hypothetical protein